MVSLRDSESGLKVNRWTGDTSSFRRSPIQHAANLLNQQIWCWGRDIESIEGNVLVRYGFQRLARPAVRDESSQYRLEFSQSSRIILRGFGVFYGDDQLGGVFLPRFKFTPLLLSASDVPRLLWSEEDLPLLDSAIRDTTIRDTTQIYSLECLRQLLKKVVDWIADYEVWIQKHFGSAFRQHSIHDWKHKDQAIPAEEMTVAWRMLGTEISGNPTQFLLHPENA